MAHLTQQIADTVTRVGVHAAYGDPVQLGDATVMPVACASYGFGAGEGDSGSDSTQGEGSGGGGGGFAVPVGAYVSRGGETRFEPNIIALIVVTVPLVCVIGKALSRIVRALKK